MKQTMTYLKALSFLFLFFYANLIYSQACGAGYTISISGNNTTCIYNLTANYPGTPTVTNVSWDISSSGASSKLCLTRSGNPLQNRFCFDGNYDIVCTLTFTGGSTCTISGTFNISCSGAIVCDPSPSRVAAIPDPVVEITYMGYTICGQQSSPSSGCMYDPIGGGQNNVACGWSWALRQPPSGYNCEFWTYYVEYTAINSCGSYTCGTFLTLDTTVQCITAQKGQPIYIVATGNHCCLPNNYQRGFIWTPNTGTLTPIGDPSTTLYGHCSGLYTCPTGNSVCNETQYTMTATSGWPTPPNCFTGGKKLEKREFSNFNENVNIEQEVIIYNIQGNQVYYGKWKFGTQSNLYLNWPDNINNGMYFVKFTKSSTLIKLFKLN